jgi:predicted transcriptional regulator
MSRLGEDAVPFSFRVPEDLKRAFKKTAQARDRSMSQEMRDFMRAYVQRHSGERQHDIQEVLDEVES